MKYYNSTDVEITKREFEMQWSRDRCIYGNVYIEIKRRRGRVCSRKLLDPQNICHEMYSDNAQLYGSSLLAMEMQKRFNNLVVATFLPELILSQLKLESIDWGDMKIQPAPRNYARELDNKIGSLLHRLADLFYDEPSWSTMWR